MTMQLHFAGLMKERLPSGAYRYRVRVEGDKTRKITLSITPDHPKFHEHYHTARAGIKPAPEPDAPSVITGSVGWLVDLYVAAMQAMQAAGQLDKSTVHQRSMFLQWLRSQRGEYNARMPQSELVRLRDMKAATPGAADNFVKSVRAMYTWAHDHAGITINPAAGIAKLNRNPTGATPWTVEDLRAYLDRHKRGTMAHLALTLFLFTACRISDVIRLGPRNEITRGGDRWMTWQPKKRGTAPVLIPIAPQLASAIDAMTLRGASTYLLTDRGTPFTSPNAFDHIFRAWMAEAGLTGRSAHGIRKSAGHLLALSGATQHQIMAIHGHASAKESEVYTRGAERAQLAAHGMALLGSIEWG